MLQAPHCQRLPATLRVPAGSRMPLEDRCAGMPPHLHCFQRLAASRAPCSALGALRRPGRAVVGLGCATAVAVAVCLRSLGLCGGWAGSLCAVGGGGAVVGLLLLGLGHWAALLLDERPSRLLTPTEIPVALERARVAASLQRDEKARDAYALVANAWSKADTFLRAIVAEAQNGVSKLQPSARVENGGR